MTGRESTSRLIAAFCDKSDSRPTSASSACAFRIGSPRMPGGAESDTLAKDDGKPGKEGQRRRPGHHEVAPGAGLDVLDQPVAHAVDGCGHEDERSHGQQQAAETQRRVSDDAEPAGALPAGPGLGASRIGHRREAVPLLSQSGAHWVL